MSDRSDKCRILTVAQDPGGAAALSPVLRALNEAKTVSSHVLARAHGKRVFADGGICFLNFDEMVRPGEPWDTAARRILREERCDLVITGTSFGPGPERSFIRAARMMEIKSFTLLDSWTNYRLRFLEPDETELSVEVLPDAIGIMNEFGKTEMEADGFPSELLHVVGHPAIDMFLVHAQGQAHAERDALRKRLNVPPGEPIFSYFSQPIEALYGAAGSQTFRGYTEWDVLDTVVETVSRLSGNPVLFVKPHIKESREHYMDLVRRGTAWRLADTHDDSLVLGSDVIIGMTSLVLVKGFLVGRAVISLQPDLQGEDQCVLARAGCIRTVTQKSSLIDALESALGQDGQKPTHGVFGAVGDGQAVARITALIEGILIGPA